MAPVYRPGEKKAVGSLSEGKRKFSQEPLPFRSIRAGRNLYPTIFRSQLGDRQRTDRITDKAGSTCAFGSLVIIAFLTRSVYQLP